MKTITFVLQSKSQPGKRFDSWATMGSKICQRGPDQEQMDGVFW